MTGNRALLKIKGQTVGVGVVQSCNIADDFGLQRVSGLGFEEAVELVTGEVSHTVSLEKYFMYNKKLNDLGFAPKSNEYLTSGELEIEIIDRISQQTMELYTGCKAANHNRNYTKHTVTAESATFFALHKSV